jgi:hypothetical protein
MPLSVFLMVAGAVLFYRMGQHEFGEGFVTAGLSLALGLITWWVFGWGIWGYFAGQAALLGAMTWYNMKRHEKWKGGGEAG